MIGVRPLAAPDVTRLQLQAAQRLFLGPDRPLDLDYGEGLIAAGPCWTVEREDGSILGCLGFAEQGPGYAVCWALLAEGLGRDHLALSRLVRERMLAAPYRRIEALIRADHPKGAQWARLVGLSFGFRVRAAGPEGEDFDLFELVRREIVPRGTMDEFAPDLRLVA